MTDFRKGRSTGEHVLSLTTYTENGFESKLNTGAVFLDLAATYDTVWGLLLKLRKGLLIWATINPNFTQQQEIQSPLRTDNKKTQKNGHRQGSVLSSTLFNLYTNDLPITRSGKLICAHDICLVTQATDLTSLEQVLN